MGFESNERFFLKPGVFYIEKDGKVFLTFTNSDEKIYQIDQLAKFVFLLAIKNYSFGEIKDICRQTNMNSQKLEQQITDLISNLIQMNVLANNI